MDFPTSELSSFVKRGSACQNMIGMRISIFMLLILDLTDIIFGIATV